jgi:hypothetical protein
LAALAGLNIQLDPRLFNPQNANLPAISAPGTKPTLVQTPFGPAEIFTVPIQAPQAIHGPTVNERYTNITARQAMQKLLDKNGLQLTQIPGNPILRVVAQNAKSPDASGNPAQPR